jgi:hypothetical protein
LSVLVFHMQHAVAIVKEQVVSDEILPREDLTFVTLKEAAIIRGCESKDPVTATRRWLERWNKRYPLGHPLHVYRQHGIVHKTSFLRAMKEHGLNANSVE